MTYGQRWIYEIIGRSRQIYDIEIFTIGISGINGQMKSVGHKKTSSERHNRTGKEKPSSRSYIIRGTLLNSMVIDV
jgi:hypothetical protein